MSPVDIVIADAAGFCWGVERALRLALEAAGEAPEPIHTLGPLIHNPAVIADLAERGIEVVEDHEGPRSGTVIIRSHGVPCEVMEALAARDVTVVDATCSYVKAAQEKAASLSGAGYLVVILGEPAHPEVLGIRSYAGPDALVVEGPDDLPADLPKRKVGVVVQTTQPVERLAALACTLSARVRELRLYNTICGATERRQAAAVDMAGKVDLVVVVGGRNSGNTTRLAQLCAAVQPATYHVEDAREVRPEWVAGVRTVGIAAGASTPQDQIDAVARRIRELAP